MTTRRALLVGAGVLGLRGVQTDLQLMHASLGQRGFEIEVLHEATRAALERSLARLIERTHAGDVVLVHFSGHGAQVELPHAPRRRDGSSRASESFLLCADFEQTRVGDFRGFAARELSRELDALTRKTKNVTLVLDCCFAGRMARGDGRRVGVRYWTLDDATKAAAIAHVSTLVSTSPHGEVNPFVVRVLGSGPRGAAHEVELELAGRQVVAGALTAALATEFGHADVEQRTWRDLDGALQRRVDPRRDRQPIAIEGPQRRRVFSLDELDELDRIDIVNDDGVERLAGGSLMDVRIGDVYRVGEQDSPVVQVGLVDARLQHRAAGCRVAQLLACGRPRARVVMDDIPPDSDEHALLAAALGQGNMLALAGDELPLAATLAVRRSGVRVELQLVSRGVPLGGWQALDPRSERGRRLADHLGDMARRLARAHMLLELPAGQLDARELAWGVVDEGRFVAMPASGSCVREGQSISVRVPHVAALRHVCVLLVGVDGRIEVLSRQLGRDGELDERGEYRLGERDGRLLGVQPRKPAGWGVSAYPVALVVVLAGDPLDLRGWEQRGVEHFVDTPRRIGGSKRNVVPRRRPLAQHRVERFEFELT